MLGRLEGFGLASCWVEPLGQFTSLFEGRVLFSKFFICHDNSFLLIGFLTIVRPSIHLATPSSGGGFGLVSYILLILIVFR